MSKRVIGFHYTLKDDKGNLLDTSDGSDPIHFLEGGHTIIPGLERQIVDMKAGERKTVHVTAAEGYGEHNDEYRVTVARTDMPPEVKIGDAFGLGDDENSPEFVVTELTDSEVVLDANHPMAGKNLVFDITIVDVRNATTEELTHGHAHGAHGHSH